MKKLPYYLTVAIAVSAVAALVVVLLSRRRNRSGSFVAPMGEGARGISESSAANRTFYGFNFNLYLTERTPNAEAEIVLLQHFINAYHGDDVIPVTGIYDAATAAQVESITSRSGVSLYQFRYYYLVQEIGDNAVIEIIKSLTTEE